MLVHLHACTLALFYWPVLVLPPGECVCNVQISPDLFGLLVLILSITLLSTQQNS